jgi:hypothetical protein
MLLPSRFHAQPMAVGVGGHVPRLAANLPAILSAMRTSIDGFGKSLAA